MPNYEDELVKKTFKGQCDDTQQRVFNTLFAGMEGPASAVGVKELDRYLHKTSKALSVLVELLEAKGILTAGEIDQLLFQATQ